MNRVGRSDRNRALDGLRAIAVLLVITYHAWINVLPGGWLGVELFFVLSGWLITTLLVAEWERMSTIDVPRFFGRRIVRLWPALWAAFALAITLAVVLYPSDGLSDTVRQAVATFFEAGNWSQVVGWVQKGPMAVTWSLGGEEQFYLVWPLLLLAALRLGRRDRGMRCALVVAVIGLVAGAISSALWHGGVYWRSDSQGMYLWCGSASALAVAEWGRPPRRLVIAATAIGSAAVLVMSGTLDLSLVSPSPLYWALVPTGAAVVGCALWEDGWLSRALAHPLLVWLGQRSYAMYLFDGIALAPVQILIGDNGLLPLVISLALDVALAAASWRLVEQPISRRFHPQLTVVPTHDGALAARGAL